MKKAILVVSFGTSYKETREKTIEACEKKIRDELEEYDFFRAFTSNMIIKKLEDRDGLHIENPIEALDRLYKEEYKEVIVQTLHIICGEEFNKLKEQIENYKDKFEKIILGRPLLTYTEDCKEVVEAIENQIHKMDHEEAVVFMGHGTFYGSNSIYAILESMLRNSNINAYIGTIEGYPRIEEIINRLKLDNIKKVNLVPFMLVSGKHVINDMTGEKDSSWKNILKNNGFEVKIHLQGLGENPYIQNKFMRHAYDCIKK